MGDGKVITEVTAIFQVGLFLLGPKTKAFGVHFEAKDVTLRESNDLRKVF